MSNLKTNGFELMLAGVAKLARKQQTVSAAAKVACTLDGRIGEDAGRAAMSLAERVLLQSMERHEVARCDWGQGWSLWLSSTGRLKVGPCNPEETEQAIHPIGTARWPHGASGPREAVERLWHVAASVQQAAFHNVARELSAEPRQAVDARLNLIGHSVSHMAPVRIYVGDRTYSNLGTDSNLPGRSLRPGSSGSILTALQAVPVSFWCDEDAVFVACASALIRSGAPTRLEEFNGRQLTPGALENWLLRRIHSYGAATAEVHAASALARIDALAACCSELRGECLRRGTQFYRSIQGLNLHKEERTLVPPAGAEDIPEGVAAYLGRTLGCAPRAGDLVQSIGLPAAAAMRLLGPAHDARFGSLFEAVLHRLLEVLAEDTKSDVAMARGPRDLAEFGEYGLPQRILKLGTNENYCCVATNQAFLERFAHDRESLVKALSAYGARMRYNTWHYLPDGLGLSDHKTGRDDWFFAPSTPDISSWTDQHHTGHVMFGVRHAIRVPIGLSIAGSLCPGLYDLRLMRTREPPFTLVELRSAIAVGRVLGSIHQAMSLHEHKVTAFDNAWFRRIYG